MSIPFIAIAIRSFSKKKLSFVVDLDFSNRETNFIYSCIMIGENKILKVHPELMNDINELCEYHLQISMAI